jgi:outer membrane protein W
MRTLLLLATAVALAVPHASGAQVTLGARLGFAIPMGDAFEDPITGENNALSDGLDSSIPLQLDASYRVTPDLAVGAYVSYGFGQVSDEFIGTGICDQPGVDCSARVLRLGVQGSYALNRLGGRFVPWVGAGIGYEWASVEAEAPGAKATFDFSGLELVNLQAGGDYEVNERFALGPFVQLAVGRYSNGESDLPGEGTVDIPMDETFHEWVTVGIRGRCDL